MSSRKHRRSRNRIVIFECAKCGFNVVEHVRVKGATSTIDMEALIPPGHICSRCRAKDPQPNFHANPEFNIPDESDISPSLPRRDGKEVTK